MSELTAGDMKQYMKVADNYPNVKTPSISDMSTPDQNTEQKQSHMTRLRNISSVPAPKRLQYLNPEIAKELQEHKDLEMKQVEMQPEDAPKAEVDNTAPGQDAPEIDVEDSVQR